MKPGRTPYHYPWIIDNYCTNCGSKLKDISCSCILTFARQEFQGIINNKEQAERLKSAITEVNNIKTSFRNGRF